MAGGFPAAPRRRPARTIPLRSPLRIPVRGSSRRNLARADLAQADTGRPTAARTAAGRAACSRLTAAVVTVIAALAALAVLAATLTACGPSTDAAGSGSAGSGTADSAAGGSAAGRPRPGGTLTFAVHTEVDCIDPHVSPMDVTSVVQRGVFDSLVAQNPDGTIVPWLAQRWTVSPDATTYTFTLREGVVFHDGTPFDAAAVKANFDHIAADSTRSQYAVALLGPYLGTQVVDPGTVKVTFARPYAAFLAAASTTYLGFHSPRKIAEEPDTLCSGGPNSVGTGPFRFTEYVKGSHAVFVRNDAYDWAPANAGHSGPAYLDSLVIRFLPEDSSRIAALRGGDIDAADAIPARRVVELAEIPSLRMLKAVPQNANYSLYLNSRREPFSDERVRRAFQHAVDVDLIVRTVYRGQYARAWSTLSPASIAYDPSLEGRIEYSPDKANRLLDEAGWTGRDGDGYRTRNGRRLTVEWPYIDVFNREQRDVVNQAIQGELKKVGVRVDLFSMDSGSYTSRRNAGGYDVIAFSWGKADPDLLRQLYASDQVFSAGGMNASGLRSPEVDAWLAAGAAITDPGARRENYARVQNYVIDKGLTLPVYVFTRTVATRDSVHGITFDADAFPMFHDAWVG